MHRAVRWHILFAGAFALFLASASTVAAQNNGGGSESIPAPDGCSWEVFTAISTSGIASATSGGQQLKNGDKVAGGAQVVFTADTATDDDKFTDDNGNVTYSQDTISYSWTANGGTPTAGTGQIFTWTAPTTTGTDIITLTVDDANDTNKGNCPNGTRNDPPKIFTWALYVCPHAHPTNFRQILALENSPNQGELYFEYTWDSTSGNKADLFTCTIGERVDYSGGTNLTTGGTYWNGVQWVYFQPPKPPFNWTHRNPTLKPEPWGSATGDKAVDTQSYGPFATPYPMTEKKYTGNQSYGFRCDVCMASQPPDYFQSLMSGIIIQRRFFPLVGNKWRYEITKSGKKATLTVQ